MRRLTFISVLFFAALLGTGRARADRQLIVAVAPNPNADHGWLRLFTQTNDGQWRADSESWPVLFGKNGMAWGRGLHDSQPGLQKTERDKRTPMGLFKIGTCYGAEPAAPDGSQWKYRQVTENDAWIEDPALPHYNDLVSLQPGEAPPPWWKKQRMKPSDPAYHWLLLIEHNYPNGVPGDGSAIFFHIRRGLTVPTAGCTTMEQANLERILKWLRPDDSPELVQLTEQEYQRLQTAWKLPPLKTVLPAAPKKS